MSYEMLSLDRVACLNRKRENDELWEDPLVEVLILAGVRSFAFRRYPRPGLSKLDFWCEHCKDSQLKN